MRPIRILVVEPSFDENGAIRASLDRAARWREAGAEVTALFVCSEGDGSRVALPPILPHVVACARRRRARWMMLGAICHGWRLARRADVIVSGREHDVGVLVASTLARLARRPLAVTVHANVPATLEQFGNPKSRAAVRAALDRADLLVPVARGIVPGLVSLGLPLDRLQVVTNGVDIARIRAEARAEPTLALPPGRRVVGVGRLSREKGFDLLIAAHAEALRTGAPPHSLLILGEGPERAALERTVEELGVGASVHLPGFVPNPHAVLARSDLFVLPSRWEGFPLSLVEAICLGVPSIATDCVSGPREVLDGDCFGDLVPVEDVPALAQAMGRHLASPRKLQEAARLGWSCSGERFDVRRAADAHLNLLTNLLRDGRQVPTWKKEAIGSLARP